MKSKFSSLTKSYRSRRGKDRSLEIWKRAVARAGSRRAAIKRFFRKLKRKNPEYQSYQYGLSSSKARELVKRMPKKESLRTGMHDIYWDFETVEFFNEVILLADFFEDEKLGNIQNYIKWYFVNLRYVLGLDEDLRSFIEEGLEVGTDPSYFDNRFGALLKDFYGSLYNLIERGEIKSIHLFVMHFINWISFMLNNAAIASFDPGPTMNPWPIQFPNNIKVFDIETTEKGMYYSYDVKLYYGKGEQWIRSLKEHSMMLSSLIHTMPIDFVQRAETILFPEEPSDLRFIFELFFYDVDKWGTSGPNRVLLDYIDEGPLKEEFKSWLIRLKRRREGIKTPSLEEYTH